MANIGIGGNIVNIEERANQGFDLYSSIEADHSIANAYDAEYRPIATLQDDGPFQFSIYTAPNELIIPSHTRLQGVISIRDNLNADIDHDSDVSGVNLFFDSLFQSLTIEINGKIIENVGNNYQYKAYYEKLLSVGKEAKKSHMVCDMYYLDQSDNAEAVSDDNYAYGRRRSRLRRPIEFSIPICSDLFNSARFLPNNCLYTVRLGRARDDFCLMSNENGYRVHFYDLSLSLRKVVPTEPILREIERKFSSKPQIFPITRSVIKTFTLPTGLLDGSLYNIFTGNHLPRAVIVGLVSQRSYAGQMNRNPYVFKNYNVSEMSVRVNNISFPTIPHRMNFPENRFQKVYRALFDNIGIFNADVGLDITMEHFKNNCFIVPFDLTPDKCNGFHIHDKLQGNMDLNLKFRTATGEAITVIIYAVFENVMIRTKDKEIELDY